MRMGWGLFVAVVVTTVFGVDQAVYVASGGAPGDGSAGKPFNSVFAARDAVRKMIAGGLNGNVTVYLKGGVYELDSTLCLDQRDGGNGS